MKSLYIALILCLAASSIDAVSFRIDYVFTPHGYFKYHEIPATWKNARLQCQFEGAVLASPTTHDILKTMREYIIVPGQKIFTGIHSPFSDGNYHTVDGIPLSQSSFWHQWAKNEPDNVNGAEYCLAMDAEGKLSDVNCNVRRHYMCYRKYTNVDVNACGTPDPEYRYENRTQSCYKFHKVPRTFERANFACSAEGGHLVVINSGLESQVLAELFGKNQPGDMIGNFDKHRAFVGVTDWGEPDDWRTMHGQSIKEAGFASFATGQPSLSSLTQANCGTIDRNGLLNDYPCQKYIAFICEKDPKYPPVVDINVYNPRRLFGSLHCFGCIKILEKMKSYISIILIICLASSCLDALRFRCDYSYSPMGWFKYHKIPLVWKDARLQCHLEGGIMASPSSSSIKNTMMAPISEKKSIFTGIHATFSKGHFHTIDGLPLESFHHEWADNEPDNQNNAESCIAMDSEGKLSDVSCDVPRPYMCHRKLSSVDVSVCGTPDSEYHFESRTNKCYKFHTKPRTWERAHFACSAEGGHLAIINSAEESAVLRDIFGRYPGGKMLGNFWKDVAFIGFHNWGESTDWTTLEGQTIQEAGFTSFSGGEPNNATEGEYCGSIYRNGLMNDLWCTKHFAFICEKSPTYPPVCDISVSGNQVDENFGIS
ncbi:macrophage mannose receptor 1-like [Anticarsia gemmatalis]|uniref:macrophage mannose receptor 1-like n=1 Tax=Anticarsia gemmatalis TaxID=129554 RepID=UPI003F76F497